MKEKRKEIGSLGPNGETPYGREGSIFLLQTKMNLQIGLLERRPADNPPRL